MWEEVATQYLRPSDLRGDSRRRHLQDHQADHRDARLSKWMRLWPESATAGLQTIPGLKKYVVVSSTLGPGIRIDLASLEAA